MARNRARRLTECQLGPGPALRCVLCGLSRQLKRGGPMENRRSGRRHRLGRLAGKRVSHGYLLPQKRPLKKLPMEVTALVTAWLTVVPARAAAGSGHSAHRRTGCRVGIIFYLLSGLPSPTCSAAMARSATETAEVPCVPAWHVQTCACINHVGIGDLWVR